MFRVLTNPKYDNYEELPVDLEILSSVGGDLSREQIQILWKLYFELKFNFTWTAKVNQTPN